MASSMRTSRTKIVALRSATQVLVEDEVEAGDLRQHFENGLEVGVAKFQGHRPFETWYAVVDKE
jgi:hypothetical protein